MFMRLRQAAVPLGILVLVAAACGGKGAADQGSANCAGVARPRIDCESEIKYDGINTSGGANVLNLGSASAKYEDVAIRRIDEHVEKYIATQSRLCRDYNACVIDAAAYHDEEKTLRDQVMEIVPTAAKVAASTSESERTRLLSQLYVSAVPSADRPESIEFKMSVDGELPADLASIKPGSFILKPNEPLPTDARVSFTFEVSSDAYLYIFQNSPKSGITVLFPDDRLGTRNPLPAGSTKRIPDGAQRFRVNDKDVGTEKVYVVVSHTPVGSMQAALAKVSAGQITDVGQVPTLSTLAAVAPGQSSCKTRALELEGPPAGCSKSRGLVLDDPEAPTARASMTVRTDPGDNMIVKVFPFEHVTKDKYRAAYDSFNAQTPEGKKTRGIIIQ
jgi:hypothetical protein